MISRRLLTEVNLQDATLHKTKIKSVSCEPDDLRAQSEFFQTLAANYTLLSCGAESHPWSTLHVAYDPVDGCWVAVTEARVERR